MVDRYVRDSFRLGETHVHGAASPPILVASIGCPRNDAAAFGAEVEVEMPGVPPIRLGWPRNRDLMVLIAINPKRTVPSADRAITDRRATRFALETPAYPAAMARAFNDPVTCRFHAGEVTDTHRLRQGWEIVLEAGSR